LTVDNGITMSAGNFDASSSSGTFSTSTGTVTLKGDTVVDGAKKFTSGTGAVLLNGATTVKDSTTFTVGQTDGAGGAAKFLGTVQIGATSNGNSKTLTVNGDIQQNNDGSGTLKTLTTATGTITLNGNVNIATGKNLEMAASGAGTFTTGTGAVSLNGDTTVHALRTFTTGQAAVTLRGDTTVSASKTFTVGAAGSGGASTLYGTLTVGGTGTNQARTVTVNGIIQQADDADGTASTFTTGTGAVTLNGHVAVASGKNLAMTSSGNGAFTSGAGDVRLYGATTVEGSKSFTSGTGSVTLKGVTTIDTGGTGTILNVGTAGVASDTMLYGNVQIGASDQQQSTKLLLYGDFEQLDDHKTDEPKNTFKTATGQITLNGNVAIDTGKNLVMNGASEFTTGTAAVTINGAATFNENVVITNPKTFTFGGAAVSCTNLPTDDTANKYCKIP